MSPLIVGPNVFSWSEPTLYNHYQYAAVDCAVIDYRSPIQIKNLYAWHVNLD